ncbi:MAG TPA: site-2 protease family protein, partial [Planctomycetaceae bacterium]|nr:site-2 protease family protein [Planctomycetaceae bacterium]
MENHSETPRAFNDKPAESPEPHELTELVDVTCPPSQPTAPPRRRPRSRLRRRDCWAIGLFIATCISTFFSGMLAGVGAPRADWLQEQPVEVLKALTLNGLSYAGPLMLILLAHEMGHYLQARRYRVPATLPFFIPMPITPFGTMGAVIVQQAGVADRKALFDIAITGPLAGLLVALPVTYFALQDVQIVQLDPNAAGVEIRYGDPLVLQWMVKLIHRPLAENEDIILTPMLFAGWVGIFITALNLMPVGQLDGGHILYTLIGRKAHYVAYALIGLAVGHMFHSKDYAYSLIIALLLVVGPRHPPTADDHVPLGTWRVLLGWLTLAFIIIGFTPRPITITVHEPPPAPA